MDKRKTGLKYGLNVSSKGKRSDSNILKGKLDAFGGSDSDEESNGNQGLTEKQIMGKMLMREASSAKSAKRAKLQHDQALREDSSVFDYDGVYEEAKTVCGGGTSGIKKNRNERPKYIDGLLQKAKERNEERERLYEVKIQKEREREGDEFDDKERFVTGAYKKKMEEMKEREREKKLKEAMESDPSARSDMSAFYRNMLKAKLEGPVDDGVVESTDDKSDGKCAFDHHSGGDASRHGRDTGVSRTDKDYDSGKVSKRGRNRDNEDDGDRRGRGYGCDKDRNYEGGSERKRYRDRKDRDYDRDRDRRRNRDYDRDRNRKDRDYDRDRDRRNRDYDRDRDRRSRYYDRDRDHRDRNHGGRDRHSRHDKDGEFRCDKKYEGETERKNHSRDAEGRYKRAGGDEDQIKSGYTAKQLEVLKSLFARRNDAASIESAKNRFLARRKAGHKPKALIAQ